MHKKKRATIKLLLYHNKLYYLILVVFSMYFKITLWMITYRTYFRCLCTNNNMSAVTTFPNFNFALLQKLQKRKVSLN